MRARADKAIFAETKHGLSRIADDYEVLAARAEQRLAKLTKLARQEHGMNADQVLNQDAPNDVQSEVLDKPES